MSNLLISENDIDKVIDLYHNKNLTQEEISKHFLCSRNTVYNFIKKYNLNKPNRYYKYEFNKSEFEELYLNKNLSIKEMAKFYNCSEYPIIKFISRNKLYKGSKKSRERLFIDIDIDDFLDKYIELNWTLRKISKHYGCSVSKLINFMKSNDIKKPKHLAHINSTKYSYSYKSYILPSGKTINIQGYENKALDELLLLYDEKDIVYDTVQIPSFEYKFKGNMHTYYPDFYIPKDNLIIEVKSKWTYKINLSKNLIKRKACIDNGFDFRFMIK